MDLRDDASLHITDDAVYITSRNRLYVSVLTRFFHNFFFIVVVSESYAIEVSVHIIERAQ